MRPDTFGHRTREALQEITGEDHRDVSAFFPEARVRVTASEDACTTWGGQLAVAATLEQLFRFDNVLDQIQLDLPLDVPQEDFNQLEGERLHDGVVRLVRRIRPGADVVLRPPFDGNPTVELDVGTPKGSGDVHIAGSDWRAYVNHRSPDGDAERLPFGPLLAASLGVAEVFKLLLIKYYPDKMEDSVRLADNLVFSPLDLGDETIQPQEAVPDAPVDVGRLWIAGLGGGGSAALYALTSIPALRGDITGVDNDALDGSNGNRHLYATRRQLDEGERKAVAASEFVEESDATFNFEAIDGELPHPLKEAQAAPDMVLAMVDKVPARRAIQKWFEGPLVDAGVGGQGSYSLLRVWPGEGMCLGCKHPDGSYERARETARTWGLTRERVEELDESGAEVTRDMIRSLAQVQQRDPEEFRDLLGRPFDEVRMQQECGNLELDLRPGFSPTLPFLTAVPGFLAAAEAVKRVVAPEAQLYNRFRHNLLWVPKEGSRRFLGPRDDCWVGCA